MRWFYNLKTSAKLISAFMVVAMILGLVGFYGLNTMSKLNNGMKSIYEDNFLPSVLLLDTQVLYQRIRINLRDLRDADPVKKREFEQIIKDITKEANGKLEAYKKTNLSAEESEVFERIMPKWQAYNKASDQAIALIYAGRDAEVNLMLSEGDLKKFGGEFNDLLDKLTEISVKTADKANKNGDETYTSSRMVTISIIVAALLLSIGLGYAISQIITRPLSRIVELVTKVANGDLTETSEINTKDEVGQLANSTNEMILNLRKIIGSVLSSSGSLSAAAQQISASTEEIASGSLSQADAAQTMNELFRELASAINSVARGAEEASELADHTVRLAQEGSQVLRSSIDGMNLVNNQMSMLEEDSNKIGEIIEVIDDIADQTNLLALNAAIEAARAGDQGRGFAVVADEVRKLAERSSEATKQITAIIKGMQRNTLLSISAVKEGVVSSQKTGEAFESIVTLVNESASKVTEIAAASEEQAAQTSEVMISIESISAVTEESAASSEETASTAQSLALLAEELNSTVEAFKI
ncbi:MULTISPECIES: methyl-accepting chemotaxis protein [unclassified Paenibacillus]|uniref:methyl-accepting chemotaxis protein n=1 Tax=unclassified Paenibacillus TaxID=185978 RepID=UPI0036400EC4